MEYNKEIIAGIVSGFHVCRNCLQKEKNRNMGSAADEYFDSASVLSECEQKTSEDNTTDSTSEDIFDDSQSVDFDESCMISHHEPKEKQISSRARKVLLMKKLFVRFAVSLCVSGVMTVLCHPSH